MAFKRDVDDPSVHNILQKRRVTELLACDIPQDEAQLLNNGKYTCLVCSYRPVFDNVNILTIHRAGKKHKLCLQSFQKSKEDFEALKLSRQHAEYVKFGKITSKELLTDAETTRNISLLHSLGAAAYDPRVKKCKATERKSRFRIFTEEPKDVERKKKRKATTELREPETTLLHSLPGSSYNINPENESKNSSTSIPGKNKNKLFSKRIKTIDDYRKHMANEEKLHSFRIRPYVSKRKLNESSINEIENGRNTDCSSSDTDSSSEADEREDGIIIAGEEPTTHLPPSGRTITIGSHVKSQTNTPPEGKSMTKIESNRPPGMGMISDEIPLVPSTSGNVIIRANGSKISVKTAPSGLYSTNDKISVNRDNKTSKSNTMNISNKHDAGNHVPKKFTMTLSSIASGCNEKSKPIETVAKSQAGTSVNAIHSDALNSFQTLRDGKEHVALSREKKSPATKPELQPIDSFSVEQKNRAQSYLNAIGSGWKKDFRTGKWVKDEEVEFDSDDEPPDFD